MTRFVEGTFATEYDPTLYDNYRHTVDMGREQVDILFDEDGAQEESTAVIKRYKDADAIVYIYSVTSELTFREMNSMRLKVELVRSSEPICPFVLVANKVDIGAREIDTEAGEALAQQWGCSFFEVSAKEGLNIQEMFLHLAHAISETAAFKGAPSTRSKRQPKCAVQ
jgi:GTPase SAR1 family protein